MVSTYLSSVKIIDSLLSNTQFLSLTKILVNSNRGSATYLAAYVGLDNLLASLGITERVNIMKSDGGFWYSNTRTPEDPELNKNLNDRPEVFLAINYAFGNPICNKKLYPLELQSSVCSGYGFATRSSSTVGDSLQYSTKTYKPTSSPLSIDVFTLRVSQNV